jgi:hypothetical protein
MTFFYDLNKRLADIADKPETKQLNEGSMGEASYSAKAARAGKDIGKPGKAFGQIAKSAGERYGSKERGEKVAGAVLAKLRGKHESVEEEYGPLEEKSHVAPEGMKSTLKGGQKKLDRNHNGRIDGQDFAILRAGKNKNKEETDESALQAYLGKKKYGKEGMAALQKAGRDGASEKTMDRIRARHDKMDETKDDDYYGIDDKAKSHRTASGGTVTTKGRVTRHQAGPGRYGGFNPETDPDKDDTTADDKTAGEKRGRGRPKGSKKALGAKGPSGKSKLMTREGENHSDEIKQAMAMLKRAGYSVTKAAEQVIEKAVSKDQAVAARIARAVQKGEVKAKSGSASAEMAKMEPKELKKFAKTDTKGLPKKVKAKEEVEETTTSGSVATSTDAPKGKGKGGVTFGKGIYDSMNLELEKMIAESMNISMNMSNDQQGGPSKSLTVTATDDDAEYLGKLLKMAGMGGNQAGGCGCNSAEQVDENSPDWPTNTEQSDDALQYSGGLNKPKTTVAGDGQTTVPVTAVQVREETEEEIDEQEQVMAPESTDQDLDEELQRIREMAGIREAAKPDYIDLDKDGDKKEPMKKAAADAEKDKKVEESILAMSNLWRAYKG